MATAQDIINEWASDSEEKQALVKTRSGLPLRWINQGQLRYVEKGQVLRDIWLPNITSTGNIALPTDFLYEFPDRVKRNASATVDIFLKKLDLPVAQARYFSGLYYYSIWKGSFYVWSAQAATPSVPYVRKPTILSSIASDLEIPTEFQMNLLPFIEAKYLYSKKEMPYAEYAQAMEHFDIQANNDGLSWRTRNDVIPTMRPNWF